MLAAGIRRPWQAVDYAELISRLPPAPEYFEHAWWADPEEIARTQLHRLRERAMAATQVPFYARRWEEAKFDPRTLTTLDDLWRVPWYTIHDIRESIEKLPPTGDYQGVAPAVAKREPMRVFVSGGTTGKSRPTFYTAWDREAQGVLGSRILYAQGIRPGDVVMNTWLYGTHNMAWATDDALYRWLNCVVLTTSAGVVTASEKQLELAVEYGVNAIVSTGDYLLRLAEVAKTMGYEVGTDLRLTALPNVGDRDSLEETFGLPYYESYGFHEVGWVAVECPARDGLHIFEDAFIVQIVDPETGEPLPDGETGAICVTELFKTGSPQIRYNILDLSFLYPPGRCACGSSLRRMGRFAGRGDNMVKLRGINIWPEAVGDIAISVPGARPDYFVRVLRENNRDAMVVGVTSDRDGAERTALEQEIARRLKERLGVNIRVEVVPPGALDELTEVRTSPKPKRFRDDR